MPDAEAPDPPDPAGSTGGRGSPGWTGGPAGADRPSAAAGGTVAAVVLAAGAGRRFDGAGPKVLTVFRGRPLVAWALEAAAAAGADEVVLVTGAVPVPAELVPPGTVVVDNPRAAEGIATSLQTGLARARTVGHVAVAVGLADQPGIPGEAWRRVVDALRQGATVAVATYAGVRRNPVGLAASVWPDLPVAGDEGARVLVRLRPDLVREVPCPGQPFDIDTVEDVARWS